MQTQK